MVTMWWFYTKLYMFEILASAKLTICRTIIWPEYPCIQFSNAINIWFWSLSMFQNRVLYFKLIIFKNKCILWGSIIYFASSLCPKFTPFCSIYKQAPDSLMQRLSQVYPRFLSTPGIILLKSTEKNRGQKNVH